MFEKKSKSTDLNNDDLGVFRPAKGTRKVIIGDGVKFKGEITDADEVQVDGSADLILETDNLVVGSTGNLKGTIKTDNADVWGSADGDIKVSGTLTIQEQGSVSGTVEYQSLQIKLGGKVSGDLKVSEKVKNINESKNKNNISLQSSDNKENTSI